GADTGNADLESIIKANHLCDELGLDTISTGSTIAAAMEMVEKGFIPEERLEGVDLRFGNSAAVVEMIWRIAYRSGFGNELAMGSYRLARRYGAEHLSMSVKRLELPAYDPRGAWGHALNYATANRGGCHVTGYMISPEILGIPEKLKPLSTEGKAKWVKDFQDFTSVVNSTVACLFSTFALFADAYADMLAPLTGWDLTPEELMVIGERIYNLERHMMVKLGFRPEEDTLPRRFLEEPMPEGPNKGSTVPLKELLREYYRVRGWENGIPTEEKLKELGIIP
ncbi:MAG: aldehyde ferredoxin oxidoreductase C-terminal domain-containing protein, partial [Thermoplasmata archaeon]|nr:aldehyde ferredoxin oxidoreductase C-terminal domain-containing protein [Thermoplasmata archaeon]